MQAGWARYAAVAVIAMSCASSAGVAPLSYPVPLPRLIAAANAQNRSVGNPSYLLAPRGTKAPISEATAAQAAISQCNEGSGTRVLVAGLVIGPVTAGSSIYWAIFMDPPGRHIAPSMEIVPKPFILNWIAAFVPVKTPRQPFCTFGHAPNLPPLPVFTDSPGY